MSCNSSCEAITCFLCLCPVWVPVLSWLHRKMQKASSHSWMLRKANFFKWRTTTLTDIGVYDTSNFHHHLHFVLSSPSGTSASLIQQVLSSVWQLLRSQLSWTIGLFSIQFEQSMKTPNCSAIVPLLKTICFLGFWGLLVDNLVMASETGGGQTTRVECICWRVQVWNSDSALSTWYIFYIYMQPRKRGLHIHAELPSQTLVLIWSCCWVRYVSTTAWD
jgi:hypothetical protein